MNKISSAKKRRVEINNYADVLKMTTCKYRQLIFILNMLVTNHGGFGGGIIVNDNCSKISRAPS